jgi:hypothetical protein
MDDPMAAIVGFLYLNEVQVDLGKWSCRTACRTTGDNSSRLAKSTWLTDISWGCAFVVQALYTYCSLREMAGSFIAKVAHPLMPE